jgi:RNA polymerase sigma-70 factor, ECF subfamily
MVLICSTSKHKSRNLRNPSHLGHVREGPPAGIPGTGQVNVPSPGRDQSRDVMENEKVTIQRAIQGDEAAMRSLWTRHAPHIDAVVRRLVGTDLDLAADIAQEVWIQIFRALPQYRGDSQFGTWAHRIAVNRTLNALRKTRRLAKIETDVEEDSASVEPEPERALMLATIENAAARLSPGARAVFLLHDVEGYTHEEIAERLGITAGGSKSQLFKARAKLRTLLAHLVDTPMRKDMNNVAPVY